ncbi:hypothetical protein FA95DRAFT_824084 [Auriscalpium vulgare]|uniref:Uncharacterized protein n=1 Tax=Auriscalpium vulgare TaxID=40419 RepID=A0ACB8R9I8_9AGAM|nr:hypothetical protein FA95DRAFT_824084 [Auriscalpium vulgare]
MPRTLSRGHRMPTGRIHALWSSAAAIGENVIIRRQPCARAENNSCDGVWGVPVMAGVTCIAPALPLSLSSYSKRMSS